MTRRVHLETIRIPSPCNANWADMQGDDRVRFCGHCQHEVYNLSGMSRDEAETLVGGGEGQLCVTLRQRPDGTVITRDCAGPLVVARRWVSMKAAAFAGAVTAVLGLGRLVDPADTASRTMGEMTTQPMGIIVASPSDPQDTRVTMDVPPAAADPKIEVIEIPVAEQIEQTPPRSCDTVVPAPPQVMGRMAPPRVRQRTGKVRSPQP